MGNSGEFWGAPTVTPSGKALRSQAAMGSGAVSPALFASSVSMCCFPQGQGHQEPVPFWSSLLRFSVPHLSSLPPP